MELLLWRHAEAEDGFPDADRRLTPRGEQQAQRMAAWIKAHAPKDLRVVASLSADFHDGCAIREMIDERLGCGLAGHGVVNPEQRRSEHAYPMVILMQVPQVGRSG